MNRREAIKAMVYGKTVRNNFESHEYSYSMESIGNGELYVTRRYNGMEVGMDACLDGHFEGWEVVE